MNRLLVGLAVLLLSGCSVFLPRDKDPVRVCGERTPIWVYNAERTDSFVGAYAQLCYTEWRSPGMEPSDSASDSSRVVTPVEALLRGRP